MTHDQEPEAVAVWHTASARPELLADGTGARKGPSSRRHWWNCGRESLIAHMTEVAPR
jgi:hypothetical protein